MKFLTLALFLAGSVFSFAQTPAPANIDGPVVITPFNWSEEDITPFTHRGLFTGSRTFPLGAGFAMGYQGTEAVSVNLRTLGSAIVSKVTSRHYALTGTLKYSNIPPGSYLEMVSYFSPTESGQPQGVYFSRTLDDSGPAAKIEGTDDGRDFALSYEAPDSKAKLVRIALNLYLAGAGGIEMSDVKLVQYPEDAAEPTAQIRQITIELHNSPQNQTLYSADGVSYPNLAALQTWLKTVHQTAPQAAIAVRADENTSQFDQITTEKVITDAGFLAPFVSITPAATPKSADTTRNSTDFETSASSSGGIDAKSFLLGVAATLLAIGIIGSFSFFLRRLKRRRHEQEMRRIASKDS